MIKKLSFVLILLLLSIKLGFANQEADLTNMLNDLKKFAAQQQECFDPIESNPKFHHLYEKLSLKIKKTTNEPPPNINDPEVVSDQDIKSILDWFVEAQKCQSKLIESVAKIDPNWAVLITNQTKRQANAVNQIVSSRPTYGSINNTIVNIKAIQQSETKKYSDNLIAKYKSKNILEASIPSQNKTLDSIQVIGESESKCTAIQINSIKSQFNWYKSYSYSKLNYINSDENCRYSISQINNTYITSYLMKADGKFYADGPITSYYTNGNKKSERFNEISKLTGLPVINGLVTEWHANGMKKSEVNYTNGSADGIETVWDENGNKTSETLFSKGLRVNPEEPKNNDDSKRFSNNSLINNEVVDKLEERKKKKEEERMKKAEAKLEQERARDELVRKQKEIEAEAQKKKIEEIKRQKELELLAEKKKEAELKKQKELELKAQKIKDQEQKMLQAKMAPIEKAKVDCIDLGFKKDSDKFKECVLELLK